MFKTNFLLTVHWKIKELESGLWYSKSVFSVPLCYGIKLTFLQCWQLCVAASASLDCWELTIGHLKCQWKIKQSPEEMWTQEFDLQWLINIRLSVATYSPLSSNSRVNYVCPGLALQNAWDILLTRAHFRLGE